MKTCSKCKLEKPLNQFHIKSAHSTGRSPSCKECDCEQKRQYWTENKDSLKTRRKPYLVEYWRNPVNVARSLARAKERNKFSPRASLRASRHNALLRRPTDNPVTLEELLKMFHDQHGMCALSGITMTWQRGRIRPTSLSIDRIDSDRGYSADNVRLVCHAINTFRGQMSDDFMFEMASAIVAKANGDKFDFNAILAFAA
jgi:hypothetical protein